MTYATDNKINNCYSEKEQYITQWNRAESITQRLEDRNHALLVNFIKKHSNIEYDDSTKIGLLNKMSLALQHYVKWC
jgi:hypothetical protein